MLMNKAAPTPTKTKKLNKKEKTGKNLTNKLTKKVSNNSDINSKSKCLKRVAKFESLKDLINNNTKLLECIENSRLNQVYDKIKTDKVDPHYFPEGNLFSEKKKNNFKKKKKSTPTEAFLIPSSTRINTEIEEFRKLHQSYMKKDRKGTQPTNIKAKNEQMNKTKTLSIEAAKKVIEQTFRLPTSSEFSEPFKKLVGSVEINLDSEEDFQKLRTPRTVMEERALKHHERKTKKMLGEITMKKKTSEPNYKNSDSMVLDGNIFESETQSNYKKKLIKNFEESAFEELTGNAHNEASGDCIKDRNRTINPKTSYNSQLEIDSVDWSKICNFDDEISDKIIDEPTVLEKKRDKCDEFFDCSEQVTATKYFDETYERLVMSTIKPFSADCCPYIKNMESSMEITPNPSELCNFKKLLKQCNKIKKRPHNFNILSKEDLKLLNDIVEADEKYHKFHKEDYELLKEVLMAQLNQIEHQKNIVGDVLKSLRSSKSEIGFSHSQEDLFISPVPSKILYDSSKTASNLSEMCYNNSDVKTMINEVPLTSEKDSSLNASVNETCRGNYDEDAFRLATEIKVIFKNLPISETSDSDTFLRNLSSRISKIPNLEKITQILETESNPSLLSTPAGANKKPIEVKRAIIDLDGDDESYDNISIKSSNCSTPIVSVRVSVKPKPDTVFVKPKPDTEFVKPKPNTFTAQIIDASPDTPESEKHQAHENDNVSVQESFQEITNIYESKSGNQDTKINLGKCPATDDSVMRTTPSKTESIHDIQKGRPKSARSYFRKKSKENDFSKIKSFLESCKNLSPYQSYIKEFPSIHDILDRIDSPKSIYTLISEDNYTMSSISNKQCNKIIYNNADSNIIGLNDNDNDLEPDIIINEMTPLCQQNVFHIMDIEYYYQIIEYKLNKINSIGLVYNSYQAQEYRIQLLSLNDLKIIKEFYVPEQQANNEFQLKKTNFFELISKPDELYTVVKNPDLINQLKITKENFNFGNILNNKIKISKSLNKLFNNKSMDEILFEVYETDSENVSNFSNSLFNISKLEAGDYEFNSDNSNCHDLLSINSAITLSTTTTTTLLLSDSKSTQYDSSSQKTISNELQNPTINVNDVDVDTKNLTEVNNEKQINEQKINVNEKSSLNENTTQKSVNENDIKISNISSSTNVNENGKKNRKNKHKQKQSQKILKLIKMKSNEPDQIDNENNDESIKTNNNIDKLDSANKVDLLNFNKIDDEFVRYERFKKILIVTLHISIFGILIWALKNPIPYCLDI